MQFQNRFFLLFLLLISSQSFFAQIPTSTNYTTAEGLSNNAVRSLFLDQKNTLWIGTENGVSVFENGSFKNIFKEDGLSHNSCWDICQDNKGNMWFASYGGGVNKFDGKKFTHFTTENGLPNNKTRTLFCHQDKIYVGTEYGISIIDISSHAVVTPKEVFPTFDVFIVTDIFEFKNQLYFSALNEGIFKIENGKSPQVIPVLNHKNVYSIGVFGSKIYSSNKGFVDVLDLDTKKVLTEKRFGSSVFWQYAQDKNNTIYAAAWGIFDNSGGLFQIKNETATDISAAYGIDSKSLLNVAYDKKNDILYAGSKDKGFYQIFLDQPVTYYSYSNKKIIDLQDNVVLHHGGVDFTSKDFKGQLTLDNFKRFQQNYVSKNKANLPDHSQGFFELDYSIPSKDIQFYKLVKHDDNYWISSNIGIFEVSESANILNYIPIHTYEFGFTVDGSFFETNPYGGVHIYNAIYKLKSNHFSELPTAVVKTLNANGKTYFLSVFKGLFSYEKPQFKSYLKENIWKEEKLKFITTNEKGNLIIGSEFGDIFIIDDSNSFEILKKIPKKSIFGNSINFIESYKSQILIGTEKGITIYNNGILRFVDKEQGLKDCNFTTSEIQNNILVLGTNQGFYKIDLTKLLKVQTTVSDLKISAISVNNTAVRDNFKWNYFNASELVTKYDKNSFSIDYVPKGHLYPNKLRYRYRIEKSNRWSPYSEKPSIFLSYLPHGIYNVEIQVLDLNAGVTKVFQLLKINIKAPFWLTWWFISLSVLILGGLLFYIIIYFKNQAKKKVLIEKRIAETKLEALLSQMNPHFTFNALNAIQNFIITNDKLNSVHFIGEFAKLMRKTLDNSSQLFITIEEELDYLKTYIALENMRFGNKIVVDFSISKEVDVLTRIPTMLLQPFVENIFVHAFSASHPNPKMNISFEMKHSNLLICKIIDNGKGLAKMKSTIHSSKGILLAKERLKLLYVNSEEFISVQNYEHGGTVVIIQLFFNDY